MARDHELYGYPAPCEDFHETHGVRRSGSTSDGDDPRSAHSTISGPQPRLIGGTAASKATWLPPPPIRRGRLVRVSRRSGRGWALSPPLLGRIVGVSTARFRRRPFPSPLLTRAAPPRTLFPTPRLHNARSPSAHAKTTRLRIPFIRKNAASSRLRSSGRTRRCSQARITADRITPT